MKFGLSEIVMNKLFGFFTAIPEIEEVILYGSRAMGNYYAGSDIDLTLKGEKLDGAMLCKIKSLMEYLNLPYFVDLSLYRNIRNPDLVAHIDQKGQTLFMNYWRRRED